MMLKVLLFAQLLYVVDEIHFPIKSGIPGVAPVNVIFLIVLLAMRGKPDPVKSPPILQKAIYYFYGALTFAFLWAQVRAFGDFMADITYYKNALFYPLFYFLHLRCKQDEKSTRQLLIWVLVIAAVAGLEGLLEGIDYGFGKYNPFRRASGPFGVDWHNANRAGVFYGMFMPMFVALVLFLKRRKLWRLAAIGGAIVTAGGAISTYSRQAYFLILLSIVLLLVRKSIILAAIIIAAGVAAMGYLPDSVFQRVEETKQEGKGGGEEVDVSTASRFELWAGGMAMLAHNPMGVGLNRFKNEIGSYSGYKHMDAHNFYVLTLAECGPQGLATLLFFIFTLFRLAYFLRVNTPPDDPETKALTIGFTVSTLCMAMGGIYGSPTLEGTVMSLYWAMCGLLERYIRLKMLAGDGKAEEAPEPSLVERFPLAAYIRPNQQK